MTDETFFNLRPATSSSTPNYIEAFNRAQIKILEKAWTIVLNTHPQEFFHKTDLPLLSFAQEIEELRKYKYQLLTLNFPPDTDVHQAHSRWLEYLETKNIKCIVYNWEFYSKNGTYTHPHIHALIYKKTCKSDIIRKAFRFFKSYLPDSASVDVREIQKMLYEKKYRYVCKNRKPDTHMRKKLKLPNFQHTFMDL